MDLVDFLRARLDEDEQVARDAHYEGQRWISEEEDVCRWPADELVRFADRKRDAAHIAHWDPARVLAEVESKRQIIGAYISAGDNPSGEMRDFGHAEGLEEALEFLALPYADHPDYRQEWKP